MNRIGFRGYSRAITDLPEADTRTEGIKGWILQGEDHQLVFFEMEVNARIPEHSHEYVEWAMLIEGKMDLSVEGQTSGYNGGNEFLIPAHSRHKAVFLTKSRMVSLFSERARYRMLRLAEKKEG